MTRESNTSRVAVILQAGLRSACFFFDAGAAFSRQCDKVHAKPEELRVSSGLFKVLFNNHSHQPNKGASMKQSIQNLLRRTFLFASVALALAFAVPATAQTVTLSGASGNSCIYTAMTVLPNGSVSVTCGTSTSPGTANFSVFAPQTIAISTTGNVSTLVSRTGGTGLGALDVAYTVTGSGCTNTGGTLSFAEGGAAQPISITTTATPGQCVVSLTPPQGQTANPAQANINVVDPSQVTNCPTEPLNTINGTLVWAQAPNQLRMSSGQIASFPLAAPLMDGKSSIAFTQGQQAATPASVTTELSISKCPGVIDTSVAQCYQKNSFVNYNQITAYTKPIYTWNSQATLGTRGCWAPASEGPWYVNVRWTYPSCPFPTGCGFSVQWTQGPY
jgi:hypothetical protein